MRPVGDAEVGERCVLQARSRGHAGIGCKDAIRSMMTGADVTPSQAFWWGNLAKYVWRWARKNGREDLEKARECIDNLLEDK